MARKKILFLITKSNWGGAQRYVFDLAITLRSEYDIVVAVGGSGTLKERLDAAGIRTVSIGSLQRDISIIRECKTLWHIAAIVRRERPDILHLNSSKAGLLGALIGRIFFVPRVIFTSHGWAFNEDRPLMARLLLKCFHWLTVIAAHTTICVSRAVCSQMNWPLVHHKMTVLNPGRTLEEHLSQDKARAVIAHYCPALANKKDEFWIGTIAELHPIKRLGVAIQAIRAVIDKYPTLRYIIIGDGESRAILTDTIARLHLTEHVFLLGQIDNAATLLPACDIFMLSSKSESYGYVLLEAGLVRLPAVATNVGGITDIVTDGKSGLLVSPDDSEALAQAIIRLIEDEPLRSRLAHQLEQETASRTLARMAIETQALYRQ